MSIRSTEVKVSKDQLPICCPPIDVDARALHQRVYLEPDKEGEAICPYCSTRYIVED